MVDLTRDNLFFRGMSGKKERPKMSLGGYNRKNIYKSMIEKQSGYAEGTLLIEEIRRIQKGERVNYRCNNQDNYEGSFGDGETCDCCGAFIENSREEIVYRKKKYLCDECYNRHPETKKEIGEYLEEIQKETPIACNQEELCKVRERYKLREGLTTEDIVEGVWKMHNEEEGRYASGVREYKRLEDLKERPSSKGIDFGKFLEREQERSRRLSITTHLE